MSDGMSKDAWLHALRSDPPPLFKAQLRDRLRAHEPAIATHREWPRRALVAAAAVVLVAVVIAVPGVRASVSQFLALFRVVHFVPVAVDTNRLDRLEAQHLEIGALIGEHVQVVQAPGLPVHVPSLDQAAAAAGMTLALPQWLPDNTRVIETTVVSERAVRITADAARLQQVMQVLGIDDLTVPDGLHGQVVNVRVPPVVMIRYESGNRRTRLFQARAPEVTLPQSVDVRALGEIGLRILGLPAGEARQFARAIDWNSTLIFPVPPTARSFRQVNINGRLGVHIEHQPPGESPTHVVLWSTGDRVFALASIDHVEHVMAMVNSVR
jgi:hypothetical protein